MNVHREKKGGIQIGGGSTADAYRIDRMVNGGDPEDFNVEDDVEGVWAGCTRGESVKNLQQGGFEWAGE